jgi:hypothetical protein
MAKKSKTKDEKLHMRSIAELGCIICNKMGFPGSPAELHHIISNTGMGKKATNYEVIPLCPHHHRNSEESYHQSPKNFTEKWGSQENLLQETLENKVLQDKLRQVF